MKAIAFHTGWKVKEGIDQPFDVVFSGGIPAGDDVILPQDAMISEARDKNCASKAQSGFYPAKTYTYTKVFECDKTWENGSVLVEFEGVMASAMVYLNGEFVAAHRYGYSAFYADLTGRLRLREPNTLKVIAVNQELSSRWYSGSGIYRDVTLWVGGRQYFAPDGLRMTTKEAVDGGALMNAACEIVNTESTPKDAAVLLKIKDGNAVIYEETITQRLGGGETSTLAHDIRLENVEYWSPDKPKLYTCEMTLTAGDVHTEAFGIRMLTLSAEKGLCVNGAPVKLRGACIHHDNGIIGATTLYAAEEFRLLKLKEAGFNAVRSAHNPISKPMLKACDRLGILVMDELTDVWCEPKNLHDCSLNFPFAWEDEVARMVRKDYNHPSVVLYSTGNEIPEIGRASGHEMNRRIVDALHRLDGTRYVTNAISGFLAVTDRLENNAFFDAQKPEGDGSEQLNAIAGDAEKQMMDAFSVSPVLSECILPVEEALDVVGYNYLTARHEYIHEQYPERVVVGSETYPTDIAELWRIAERNPHVIGDFTWTGYDYLGEAGIGIFHYDTDNKAQGWYPDRVAYVGDINLNAYRRPVSYLREIAFGLRKKPYLFVERVDKAGHTHDKNHWKYKDGLHNWTYPGYEGTPATVCVLSPDPEAELFLNGVSLGKQKVGEKEALTAIFTVPYAPGTLTARTLSGEDTLETAGEPVGLRVEASKRALQKGGRDVCFITADLIDAQGIINRFAVKRVTVSIKGAAVIAGFGSASPSGEGSYSDKTCETFDGRVMVAVRSGMEAGSAEITLTLEGKPCACTTVFISGRPSFAPTPPAIGAAFPEESFDR